MPPSADHLWAQVAWLFILAIPVACVAWTVTHEEVFREPREYCKRCSQDCRTIVARKFFYLFTCEYCFSHYVTGAFLLLTRYRLLMDDWRGYILSFFGLVFVANMYMSLYSRLRVDIRSEKAAANVKEHESELKRLEAITKEQETRMHSSRAGNGAHGVYEMTKDDARSSNQ